MRKPAIRPDKAIKPSGIPNERPMIAFRPSPSFPPTGELVGGGGEVVGECVGEVVVESGGVEELGRLRVEVDDLKVVGTVALGVDRVLVLVLVVLVLVRIVLVDVELDLCAATIQQPEMTRMRRSRMCIVAI